MKRFAAARTIRDADLRIHNLLIVAAAAIDVDISNGFDKRIRHVAVIEREADQR